MGGAHIPEEVGDALMKWLQWSSGTILVVGCLLTLFPLSSPCSQKLEVEPICLSWQGYYQGSQDVWGSIWRGKTSSGVYGFFLFGDLLSEDFTAGRPEEDKWAGSWIWNPLSDDDVFGVLPPVALFLCPGPELILMCADIASIAVSAFSGCSVGAPPIITLHW